MAETIVHPVLSRPKVYLPDSIVSVHIFEKQDTLTIGCLIQRHWEQKRKDAPAWAPKEEWRRNVKGPQVTLSLKQGRPNLYLKTPSRRKRKKLYKGRFSNITNQAEQAMMHIGLPSHGADIDRGSILHMNWSQIADKAHDWLQNRGVKMPTLITVDGESGRSFAQVIYLAAYPLIGELVDHKYYLVGNTVPAPYSTIFRGQTAMECCKRAFGKKGTRKVASLMMSSLQGPTDRNKGGRGWINFSNIFYALVLKKRVGTDHLQQILSWTPPSGGNDNSGAGLLGPEMKIAQRFFNRFDLPRVMRFAQEAHSMGTRGWDLLSDTEDILSRYTQIILPNRIRGLEDLHNYVAREQRRLKLPNYAIPMSQELAQLQGHVFTTPKGDEFKLVFPETYYQLCQWGALMNHCIASYGREARAGKIVLLGIEKNGVMAYSLELETRAIGGSYAKEIAQFYGPRNSSPPKDDNDTLRTWLFAHKGLWKGVENCRKKTNLVALNEEENAKLLRVHLHPDEMKIEALPRPRVLAGIENEYEDDDDFDYDLEGVFL